MGVRALAALGVVLVIALLGIILLIGDTEDMATDYGQLRSVTFYVFPFDPETYVEELESSLPRIIETGFNAVWIVNPWMSFNPEPLSDPPVYDDSRFSHLREVLSLLRANGMEAILGLNYLGEGWAPEGIDAGAWIVEPEMYHAFEVYVEEFLRRIEDFHDIVYILVFTEATEPRGLDPYADAEEHAALLRETLGSLPDRLDPELRGKFRIGYHDYSLINLDWARGDSPIRSPASFDFLSMVFYGWEDKSDEEISDELGRRVGFFKALYPNIPLILGEMGASICSHGEENQARVIAAKASTALSQGLGFNLWHWRPIPEEDQCKNPAFMGLAVTNEDGSEKMAVARIRELIG